jgi:outer membrane receptor protein involved in Fe transport
MSVAAGSPTAHPAPRPAPTWQVPEVLESDLAAATGLATPAQFQQPALPQVNAATPTPLPAAAVAANQQLYASFGVPRSALAATSAAAAESLLGSSFVTGNEAPIRATTDAGDLLGSSPSVLNLGIQRRNPIVTDPRVRGSRVGALAASGSYWVPARIDLDTVLSKIDSRIVDHMVVVPGPYTTLWGPGFEFIDFQLLRAPRYANGFELHGQTVVDYKTNGQGWYGRQSAWGGSRDWGFRLGYGHATGNDYDSGNGTQIPSSYKSRDVDAAFGADLTDNSSFDGNYIRLDQTDVELPGQAFDIDYLKTDGYDVAYVLGNQERFDQFLFETWYNRTVFAGSAQRPGKRAMFPYFNEIRFVGNTDVDSMSTGYRAAWTWEGDPGEQLTAGADLRYIKQELNEITSGRIGFSEWEDVNSPIPRSHQSNPGLFAQLSLPAGDAGIVTTGARVDWVSMNIDADPSELDPVGTQQTSAAAILGSDQFDQDHFLGSAFVALDVPVTGPWWAGASVGYAERSPNLTERYAVEPFMFLIQNGLNTITGDPRLNDERLCQVDLRMRADADDWRGGVTAFHGWAYDYITFENMHVVYAPPDGLPEQVNLKYVNTKLATLAGVEFLSECDLYDWLVPFATLKYVQGTDRTRNGTFATEQATSTDPSQQVPGMVRGEFSGITAGNKEPLPSILPLESRLGVRLVDPVAAAYGLELYARVVDNQNRVAASLLETPTPGFTVWDVRTFVRPMDNLLLVSGVENFTDKNYREHLDFRSPNGRQVLQPGVNFYFGSELTY